MNKKIKIAAGISFTLGLIIGIFVYSKFFTSNTKFSEKEFYVNIPSGSKYQDVKKIIEPFIDNYESFEFIAQKRSYIDNVKSGRFLFEKGMSSFGLVSSLRHNVPVNLAFNNQERLENLCERISTQIVLGC